jgi:ArsR family transcriptional regulator
LCASASKTDALLRAILSFIDDNRYVEPLMHHDDQLAELSKALAHPARLRIVRLLQATPGCIGGDIVGAVGLAQSTVSEHLRILKAAGIISGEIDGPRVCYALNPDALAPLAEFIASLTALPGDVCCVPTRKETP